MAFTLEDGSGVAGSNAYVSTAFVDTYATDRGFTAWTGADSVKQSAIILATDHVDRRFGSRFKGYKSTSGQGLQWPRTDAWDDNDYSLLEVPSQLQNAIAEYAIRALLYGVLTPDAPPINPRQSLQAGATLPTVGTGSGEVILARKKVGPLEVESRYTKNSSGKLDSYPAADLLLVPILTGAKRTIIRA